MRLQNLQIGPGAEQMNRAFSGMDGITQRARATELALAVSAFKLEAYASAQMQREAGGKSEGRLPCMRLRAA